MNVSGSDVATTGAHLFGLAVGVVILRHRLGEVAVALADIAKEWVNNRAVGQQRDKLWETLSGKIDENTREQRAGFERQAAIVDQRLALQDAQIAEVKSSVAAILSEIAALKLHVSTLGAKP